MNNQSNEKLFVNQVLCQVHFRFHSSTNSKQLLYTNNHDLSYKTHQISPLVNDFFSSSAISFF